MPGYVPKQPFPRLSPLAVVHGIFRAALTTVVSLESSGHCDPVHYL